MMRTILVLGTQALILVATTAAQEHGSTPHWTYDGKNGPAHWSNLDATYKTCGAGRQQSPIAVGNAVAADLPAIEFHYQPSPTKLVDNGHTVQVSFAPGNSVTVGNETYQLRQFHFHHPAEETLNGKAYPLEAHLVHANQEGRLAVITVVFAQGGPNDVVANLWRHLPAEHEKEVSLDDAPVDANALIPKSRGYYTFSGSLTTPPCSEGVTWFVLKSPITVSKEQIAAFAARYPHNARPLQPRNGRPIQMTR